jgi:hypothetical protein
MDRTGTGLLVLGSIGLVLFAFIITAAMWPLPKGSAPSDDAELSSLEERLITWRAQAEDSDRRLWNVGMVLLGIGSLTTATAGFAGYILHAAAMRRLT